MISGEDRMGDNRVIQDGSWNDHARTCRAANRTANHPLNQNDNLGFDSSRAQRGDGGRFTDPVLIRSGSDRRTGCGRRCVSRSPAPSKSAPRVFFDRAETCR